jgi:formate--tetrahydrofolate ligase
MKSDIEIAREATAKPVISLAGDRLGIEADHLVPIGHDKAKVSLDYVKSLDDRPDGKLILVTAITPTPAGEGKTTTTVGLGDGLNKIGKDAVICLREPSLGPCFGVKGGAAGGGFAQVIPMEDINLHFTGDMHAIGAANNLLAAMIDNHVYWGNKLDIDVRRITWRRAVDMNDRSLRNMVSSVGGVGNGFPREAGFDITVASEIMAILCLSTDAEDLQRRLGNIVIGQTRDRQQITASQIEAHGAMSVLLKDALMPNLVQTLENNPAFVHGGPFANIAHGCNTVVATKTALKLADYVITEAGFGADLGAEKFLDIKCRKAGLNPELVVLVATIRALKMHGGVARGDLGAENVKAVEGGMDNLRRHIENLQKYGLPVVVCVNKFSADTAAEVAVVTEGCEAIGIKAVQGNHWADGGAGTTELAQTVVDTLDEGKGKFKVLYPDEMPLWDKVRTIAQEIYRADDITGDQAVLNRVAELQEAGYGHFPICMAKTQYSFSHDPNLKNAPSGYTLPVREVRLSGGAEFIVMVCGDIMTMPGLPSVPAANAIHIDDDGNVAGLF